MRLRQLREGRVLSLNDLARLAKVNRATILYIEQGKHAPHPSTIRKLAEALGVEPAQLLKDASDG